MHHMQSVSPKHSPMRTIPYLTLILPISVISTKQTHVVKGLMLHSGHVGIKVNTNWYSFELNGT